MRDDKKLLIERMVEAALAEATREVREERDELELLLKEEDKLGELLERLASARPTIAELVVAMELTRSTLSEARRSNLPDLADRLLDQAQACLYAAIGKGKERK